MMLMRDEILFVGVGGFIGAICRYQISSIMPKVKDIPTGTMTVNITGSFILAILTFTALEGSMQYFASIGILGSFTTFSTFAYESSRMLEKGKELHFLMNIGLNAVLCFGAVTIAAFLLR